MDDFGENATNETYQKFFQDHIVNRIKIESSFDKVELCSNCNFQLLEYQTLKVDTVNKVNLKLPKKNVDKKISTNDFILFIGNIETSSGYMTGTNSSSKDLHQSLDYAIYDNSLYEFVSYGKIKVKWNELFPVVTIDTWKSCIEQVGRKIISKSPFKKQGY